MKAKLNNVIDGIGSTMYVLAKDLDSVQVKKRGWLDYFEKRAAGKTTGPLCGEETVSAKMRARIDMPLKEYNAVKKTGANKRGWDFFWHKSSSLYD